MKILRWLLVVLLLLAVAAGGAWYYWNATYLDVAGVYYRRDTEVFDLRGQDISIAEYEALRAECPDSTIYWDIPLQGKAYSPDAEEVRMLYFSADGAGALDYLPNVKIIHAEECRDYEHLMAFQRANPQIHVLFQVPIGQQLYSCTVEELTLDAEALAELEEKLDLLHELKAVAITGTLPEAQELLDLTARHPEIAFTWSVQLGSKALKNTETKISISANDFTRDCDPIAQLRYLNHLERADMRASGLTEEKLREIADAFPEVSFVWDTTIFSHILSTDVEEIDFSNTHIYDLDALEAQLSYFRNLKTVYMSYCGVSDEDMDALNRRHENVRYIWTVNISGLPVRTDEKTFMPAKHRAHVDQNGIYALRYCTDMECIDLGHMWVVNCDWAAFMPNLTYLILGETGVSDITPLTGLTKLKYLELFTVPVRDYTPLVTCTGLEDLNLGLTYGDPTPIARMTWLKNLSWCDCTNPLYPSKKAEVLLPEALPDTRIDLHPSHPGDGWWRFLDNYYKMRDMLEMPYLNQDGVF